jgi:hypothetical protein
LKQTERSRLVYNEFKKGYHPKNNIVKDKKHDLVTDSHSISIRWRNCFSQLFSVHGVSDVRQTEMHTEEPLLPEPSALEVEMATEKLRRYKSLGTGQIPVEKSKAGVEQFALRPINALILFGIRQNCLRSGRSLSLYLSTGRVIKQNVVIIEAYHFQQLHTKFYPTSCCQGQFHTNKKLLGTISEDFNAKGQLLNIYFAFIIYLRKWEYNETMHQLFINFKKAYESVIREALYNFLIQFGIPMKLTYLLT